MTPTEFATVWEWKQPSTFTTVQSDVTINQKSAADISRASQIEANFSCWRAFGASRRGWFLLITYIHCIDRLLSKLNHFVVASSDDKHRPTCNAMLILLQDALKRNKIQGHHNKHLATEIETHHKTQQQGHSPQNSKKQSRPQKKLGVESNHLFEGVVWVMFRITSRSETWDFINIHFSNETLCRFVESWDKVSTLPEICQPTGPKIFQVYTSWHLRTCVLGWANQHLHRIHFDDFGTPQKSSFPT